MEGGTAACPTLTLNALLRPERSDPTTPPGGVGGAPLLRPVLLPLLLLSYYHSGKMCRTHWLPIDGNFLKKHAAHWLKGGVHTEIVIP